MTFHVQTTEQAEQELLASASYWAENRSVEEAIRWYDGFIRHIRLLSEMPTSCPRSAECDDFPYEIRDLLYGVSSRATHRAVFTIVGNRVVVLTIRHHAQDRLATEDIVPFDT